MRSSVKKKRRRRIIIEWRPVLWTLLLINVVAGLETSKVTRLTRVVVEGVPAGDQDRIREIAESVANIPCLRINPRNIESLALDGSAVRTAELSRNIFGSGRFRLSYRHPVAVRLGRPDEALSADGILYRTSEIPPGLPSLQMPMELPIPTLTIAGEWRGERIAWLAQEASEFGGTDPVRIVLAKKGTLSLFLAGGRVELGGPTDLERKMEVLKARLTRDPGELQRVEALVLTDPETPAIVRPPEQKPSSSERAP